MAWGQLLKTLLFLSKNYVNTPRDVYVSAITKRLWLRGLRLLQGAILKASLVLLSGSNICHHKMCLFGRRISSGWFFCKKLRLRKWALLPPHNRLKVFRQRACSQNRTITRDLCEHRPGAGVGWGVGTSLETRVTLRPRSLQAQQTSVHQTPAFPSPRELLFSPLSSQTTTPDILSCL